METTLNTRDLHDIPSVDQLKQIMENTNKPCVSIYMPLHGPGTNVRQDAIRLGDLLRQAHELLIERGLSIPAVESLLKPARKVLSEDLFWQHPGDALAIFASPDSFHFYLLPLHQEQRVVVSNHFHIRPLLSLFAPQSVFYVLAISLNQVRLLKSTIHSSVEVELPKEVPGSLSEALKYDSFEQQRQLYTGTPGWGGGKQGRPGAVFFGQGASKDVEKENILRYFQKVDNGLHSLLRQETVPLVAAGVDYLLPIYREANSYPHLVEGGIAGNPDHKSLEELRLEALTVVGPLFERTLQKSIDQYMQLAGTGQTTDVIEEVVRAAYHGQVDTLFVASGAECPGSFDAATDLVEVHEGAGERVSGEDLLDLAALYTLRNQGTVYALELNKTPSGEVAAAVLRG